MYYYSLQIKMGFKTKKKMLGAVRNTLSPIPEEDIGRILTMMYVCQNYWVSGLSPSSDILEIRE
jgi:hypothetical protein